VKFSLSRTFAAIGITVAAVSSGAVSTPAANIVDEWASVKAPPPPELKPVTVDPNTTALLMLDFMNQNCGKRPRCVETIPAMKKLLDEARAAKAPTRGAAMKAGKKALLRFNAMASDEPAAVSRWPG
jgi:hypothetical protein